MLAFANVVMQVKSSQLCNWLIEITFQQFWSFSAKQQSQKKKKKIKIKRVYTQMRFMVPQTTRHYIACWQIPENLCEFSVNVDFFLPQIHHIFHCCVFLQMWTYISIQLFIPPSTSSVKQQELWEISVSDPVLPQRTVINVYMFCVCFRCLWVSLCPWYLSVCVCIWHLSSLFGWMVA